MPTGQFDDALVNDIEIRKVENGYIITTITTTYVATNRKQVLRILDQLLKERN